MDRIQLELHRLNWRMEILQAIAVDSYTMAFSALRATLDSPQQSLLELSARFDRIKEAIYRGFFSSDLSEEDRTLLAEEFAHLVEEMKSSLIPPGIFTPNI